VGASRGARPSADLIRQAALAVEALVEDLGAQEVAITPEIGQTAFDASAPTARPLAIPPI
jgi:ribonuclease VapC